jgi:hypothetical protein
MEMIKTLLLLVSLAVTADGYAQAPEDAACINVWRCQTWGYDSITGSAGKWYRGEHCKTYESAAETSRDRCQARAYGCQSPICQHVSCWGGPAYPNPVCQ